MDALIRALARKEVAEASGVNVSTVCRLIRKHGARRKGT